MGIEDFLSCPVLAQIPIHDDAVVLEIIVNGTLGLWKVGERCTQEKEFGESLDAVSADPKERGKNQTRMPSLRYATLAHGPVKYVSECARRVSNEVP